MARWKLCYPILLLMLALMLESCLEPVSAPGGQLQLGFAQKALDGPCPEVAQTEAAPPTLERLEIILYQNEGQEHFRKTVTLTEKSPKIGGIPAGSDLLLQVIGYGADQTRWAGTSANLHIVAGLDTTASVFMSPIGETSCLHRPLSSPRAFQAPATTGDGRTLLAGGSDQQTTTDCGPGCRELIATAAVDFFDPSSGSLFPGPRLHHPRLLASATALPDGAVLVLGGVSRIRLGTGEGLPISIATDDLVLSFEVFLPAEDLWIEKPMPAGMVFHTATPLPDGRVLLTGGGTGFASNLASEAAYLFDPAGESVGELHRVQSNMASPRLGHAAVLSPRNSVFLIGGAIYPSAPVVEEFVPSADGGVFTAVDFIGSPTNLFFHSAAIIPLRPDEILVAGGCFYDGESRLNAPMNENVRILSEISSPTIKSSEGPSMTEPHWLHAMTAPGNDRLLISGGFKNLFLSSSASLESFDPSDSTMSSPTELSVARAGHVAIDVNGSRSLLAGGLGPDGLLGSAELFTPDPE